MLCHINEADSAFQKLVAEKKAELDDVFSSSFLKSLQHAIDHEFAIGHFSKTSNGQYYTFSNILDLDIHCRRIMLAYAFLDKCNSLSLAHFIQSFIKVPRGVTIRRVDTDILDRMRHAFAYDDYRTMTNVRSDVCMYVCCFLPVYMFAKRRYKKTIDSPPKRISCKFTLEFSWDI